MHTQHALPPEAVRVALEEAPDAMLIVDLSGTIRFANQSVTELFGHPHGELIGRSVEVLVPERFRKPHADYRGEFTRDKKTRPMGGQRLDLFGLRTDGSEFPVAISLKTVYCHPEWITVAAIRDMTSHVTAESRLREAMDQANHASLAKSRFLSTASHDLRQPLQTLALLNGALRRMVADRPAASDVVMQQEHAIASMSRLLNALLDISKLESGAVRPNPTEFAVGALFEELREGFSRLAEDKGLAFKVTPCEESVRSDPALVGQILRNLVSNAIKYTRQGSVALRCVHDDPALVRIEVLDTGVGIPADQLRHIYDEFFQVGGAHNPARQGYGLGLSIVRRLVTLLDLKLEVQSEVGSGSLFALTLPTGLRAASAARRIEAEPPAHGAPAQIRILLVEDDTGVRNATRMLFRAEGYDVTAVASFAEALEQARRDPRVDLLVTDYHLGNGTTGSDVIASVREALGRPIKAVLMTGDTSSAIQMLPADPRTKVASKPVNADELLQLLRALLTPAEEGPPDAVPS
ncbi:MAG TPA: ATP-binding protein [Steroidobacteraceae bacterium]|nr:ATP-binding protein [Steroidobacteraceae bacterium]